MAAVKTCGSTTTRLDHPNTDEAEGNDFKSNFRKMIEALKEKVKNFLIEVKGKTNEKFEVINKSI